MAPNSPLECLWQTTLQWVFKKFNHTSPAFLVTQFCNFFLWAESWPNFEHNLTLQRRNTSFYTADSLNVLLREASCILKKKSLSVTLKNHLNHIPSNRLHIHIVGVCTKRQIIVKAASWLWEALPQPSAHSLLVSHSIMAPPLFMRQ